MTRHGVHCRQCGYDLRELATTECPECGATFDPGEPSRVAAAYLTWPNARCAMLLIASVTCYLKFRTYVPFRLAKPYLHFMIDAYQWFLATIGLAVWALFVMRSSKGMRTLAGLWIGIVFVLPHTIPFLRQAIRRFYYGY